MLVFLKRLSVYHASMRHFVLLVAQEDVVFDPVVLSVLINVMKFEVSVLSTSRNSAGVARLHLNGSAKFSLNWRARRVVFGHGQETVVFERPNVKVSGLRGFSRRPARLPG